MRQARLTSDNMTSTTTAPMVALMMSRTQPMPRLTPSAGSRKLATSAPMMPTTMLPISPKPAPCTIFPASQPAIAPMISAAMRLMATPKLPRWEAILVEIQRRSRACHAGCALDLGPAAGNLSGMFLQFFTSLRDAQVPVTLREYLTLMEALDEDLAEQSVENFYYLSRAALV